MNAIATIITPVVSIQNNQVITTSLEVARIFSKRHDHVMRSIESLIFECGADHAPNFGEMVFDVEIGSGAVRQSKGFNLTKDGFTLLAMGFTGKRALQFKLAYIAQFNAMETALTQPQAKPLNAPSSIDTRKPLAATVSHIVQKYKVDYSDVYVMVHKFFNIDNVIELMDAQIPQAIEYLNRVFASNALPAPEMPIIISLPRYGRYFVDTGKYHDNRITIKDIEHCNIVDNAHFDAVQRDLYTLQTALRDMSERTLLMDGERNASIVAQPLQISLTAA